MNLRPYQVQLKTNMRGAFMRGMSAVIMCSPTGSGKTVTFADIARESVNNGFTVMVAVDRKELLEQARDKLIEYGLSPAIITAGKTMRKNASCYVATVQTLKRRVFPEINLLIVDEAHKQIFDPVVKIYKEAGAMIIGATATPVRTGKMTQLSDIYDDLIEAITIQDLIQQEFLVPAITFAVKTDTGSIGISKGDYDVQQAFEMFDKKKLYDGVVEKYQKFAQDTKAICFNVNVEHSKKVTDAFNNAGITSAHIDGTTPKAQRENIIKLFKQGYIKVLNNVDILTTGFDEWTVETVIMNRITISLALWLQIGGRGSRITPKQFQGVPGYLQKTHFNFIDMGGNVYKLGFWEQERKWNLTHKRGDKLGIAPVKVCPEDKFDEITKKVGCGAMLPAPAPRCKYCGYTFPKEEKGFAEGEFIQVENYTSLPAELIGKSWATMSIDELEQVREIKGYKQGWIIRQISMNPELSLMDYAIFKKYNYPAQWVERMEKMYKLSAEAPIIPPQFYYYTHPESDAFWKQTQPYQYGASFDDGLIQELTYEQFIEGLALIGLPDSDELINNLNTVNT